MTSADTVGEALKLYLQDTSLKLNGTKRRSADSQAQRFTEWVKPQSALSDLKPYDVESFINGTVSGHSSDASERVDGLRHFLDYLFKAHGAPNLKKEAKVPRVKGIKRSAGTREETVVHRLTADGFKALTEELENLRGQRKDIQGAISDARADKDFRENAPLDAARERQALNESRITEIEAILKHSEIVHSNGSAGVNVGSTIVVRNLKTDREQKFTIVHPREVNPSAGKISIESPVGQAVVGRGPGEEVEVQAPSGSIAFRIESVE
jgi:transcription elongation factor GreA